jgi:hypothetical protein
MGVIRLILDDNNTKQIDTIDNGYFTCLTCTAVYPLGPFSTS